MIGAATAIGAGISGLMGFFDQRRRNRGMEEDRDYTRGTRDMASGQADQILNNPGSYFLGPDGRSISDQAAQFHNPYQNQVIEGIRSEYDHLRGQAGLNQAAGSTLAGAFGGDRHQLQLGAAMGELGRGQAQQVGNLLHNNWTDSVDRGLQYSEYERALRERQAQEPIYRAQTAVGLRNAGAGPMGLPQGGSPLAAGLGTGIATFGQLGKMRDDWDARKARGTGLPGGPMPGPNVSPRSRSFWA